MRLTSAQIETIKTTARNVLGEGVQVWLYGSRVDDRRKGGDIDLLIESTQKVSLMIRARIKHHIETALELPVDILMVQTGQPTSAFETIARSRAVALTTQAQDLQ
jgi:predicted nucleotidyltransferase